MELRISVPANLQEYLEYIPEEYLPGILLSLIEERIHAGSETRTDDSSILLLKQIMASVPTAHAVENVQETFEESTPPEPTQPTILQQGLSSDDDLDDLMDFLK